MKFEAPENLDTVSESEVESFQEEIEEKVEEKAKELEISREELIDLAGLDLESLEAEKLKELNLSRGEFDFIRKGISEAINEFQKSEKLNTILKDAPSSIDKLLRFIREHKKVVSIGELALYISSFGLPALNALAENDAKVEINGERISLKDLADNPELIKEIDQANNAGTPIDILREYPTEKYFDYGNDDTKKSFSIFTETEVKNNNELKKTVSLSFSDVVPTVEEISRLNSELHDIGISLGISEHKYKEGNGPVLMETEGSSWEDFIENKEQVAKVIANNFNISENAVEKYIDNLIMPDVSKISVVELDDFEINKNLEIPEDALKLGQKFSEICEKHQKINSDFRYWLDASNKEFTEWVKENGYENIENSVDARKLLIKEKEDYNNLPALKFEDLKSQEKEKVEYKNIDKFKDLFLEGLNGSGYSVEELRKIAEENPEEVIKIISEVIGKNVSYDWLEYLDIKLSEPVKELTGKDINYLEEKHSQGIPYITMESGKGVCHDYAITFMAAKYILEEENVPNLDKFMVVSTFSGKMNHQWSNLVTMSSDGKLVVSSLDSTWADSPGGKLNAVDEKHYYTGSSEEIDEAHQESLDKIKDWNRLVKQEKLKEILTTYDPRLHRKEREIKENKKMSNAVKETRGKLRKLYHKK
ncbi:MAG: hypothetical protein U9N04_00535, partial [Patescibacteria group bacterium]|nr:hypothetical protein [Patescibacteria group bacterium]